MTKMHKTVVIDVPGLTRDGLRQMPFLQKWSDEQKVSRIRPVLPAVTTTAQTTYLTGKLPTDHGIVANGWYFKDECEVKFWRQSNKLVQTEKIWDRMKREDPSATCANHFWWYNMYSTVDFSVTPRPNYLADGRKLPDIYTAPVGLRDELQQKLGTFPLFDFWGPRTSIRSTQWIADAALYTDRLYSPTLTLIYLPHLDYNYQRYGKDHPSIPKDLAQLDKVMQGLIEHFSEQKTHIIVLSEYGISNVSRPVHINRVLRENGLLAVREERGLELLDPGASEAFAVADHQIAHVYTNNPEKKGRIKEILEEIEGIEKVLDQEEKAAQGLDHDRSGDLVALADKDSWFTYYYWLDDRKAPDFARTVDIHRKPGYDPAEMIADPHKSFLGPRVALKLLKKKLGFRTLMDLIPLDATLVKGSHGRIPEDKADWPVACAPEWAVSGKEEIGAEEVYGVIFGCLNSK